MNKELKNKYKYLYINTVKETINKKGLDVYNCDGNWCLRKKRRKPYTRDTEYIYYDMWKQQEVSESQLIADSKPKNPILAFVEVKHMGRYVAVIDVVSIDDVMCAVINNSCGDVSYDSCTYIRPWSSVVRIVKSSDFFESLMPDKNNIHRIQPTRVLFTDDYQNSRFTTEWTKTLIGHNLTTGSVLLQVEGSPHNFTYTSPKDGKKSIFNRVRHPINECTLPYKHKCLNSKPVAYYDGVCASDIDTPFSINRKVPCVLKDGVLRECNLQDGAIVIPLVKITKPKGVFILGLYRGCEETQIVYMRASLIRSGQNKNDEDCRTLSLATDTSILPEYIVSRYNGELMFSKATLYTTGSIRSTFTTVKKDLALEREELVARLKDTLSKRQYIMIDTGLGKSGTVEMECEYTQKMVEYLNTEIEEKDRIIEFERNRAESLTRERDIYKASYVTKKAIEPEHSFKVGDINISPETVRVIDSGCLREDYLGFFPAQLQMRLEITLPDTTENREKLNSIINKY